MNEEDGAKTAGEIDTSRVKYEEEQKRRTVFDVKNFSFGTARPRRVEYEGRVYDACSGRLISES